MEIEIFEMTGYRQLSNVLIARGTIRARYTIFGYHRIDPLENKVIETVDLETSSLERILEGCWIEGKSSYPLGLSLG